MFWIDGLGYGTAKNYLLFGSEVGCYMDLQITVLVVAFTLIDGFWDKRQQSPKISFENLR